MSINFRNLISKRNVQKFFWSLTPNKEEKRLKAIARKNAQAHQENYIKW